MENNQLELETKTTKQKVLKIVNIVLNVIFYIFIAAVLIFAITTISAKDYKSVPNLFGKGYLVVQSDSMAGEKEESFDKGELIVVSVLKDEDKKNLKEGDIITFFDVKIKRLNTHRIISVMTDENGLVTGYETKGDNTIAADEIIVSLDNVVAKYNGTHSVFWGKLIGFITDTKNPLGFILCIILPALLFLVYTIVMFVKSIMAINIKKTQSSKDDIIAEYEANKLKEEEEKAATAAKLAEMEAKIAELEASKKEESEK